MAVKALLAVALLAAIAVGLLLPTPARHGRAVAERAAASRVQLATN